MGVSSLRAGVQIAIGDTDYTLLRKVDGATWQLEASRTLRIQEFKSKTLMQLYQEGRLIFSPSDHSIVATGKGKKISDISGFQWALAKVRRSYVIAVLHMPGTKETIRPVIEARWRQLGTKDRCPDPATVLRWKKRYLESGQDITSLVDQNHRKGNRSQRYGEESYELVNDVIDEVYMTDRRKTYQDVLDEAIVRTKKENQLRPKQIRLRRPTIRFVKRLIKLIPKFDRVCARHGRSVALNRFRSVQCYLVADLPLERAEIDHTPLDLIVIDDDTFLPLGRPWLTVCIDVRTRCVLGIYLGFEPPSHLTVAACLKNAFLPKVTLQADYPSIKNPWLAHGVMAELVVDNGSEFHSVSLENACYSLGIEIHYSARKTPWHKGKVERFIKTLNDGVSHGAPGTTFSNILEKGDYDPCKHAVVRLSKIKEIVCKWVADYYHQKPHRALGIPPELDWKNSIADEDILLPDDPAVLDALLGRTETRVLTHKGIELDCLFYNSPEMSDLRKRYGEKFEVQLRIDDSDIGHIMVVCPHTGDLYRVPALHADYANGLSRWQHGVCKNFAAKEFKKSDPETWLEAKHEISRMVHEEFLTKAKGTRSRAARYKSAESKSGSADMPSLDSTNDHQERPSPAVDCIETNEPEYADEPLTDDDIASDSDLPYRPIEPIYRSPLATFTDQKDIS